MDLSARKTSAINSPAYSASIRILETKRESNKIVGTVIESKIAECVNN